MYMVLSSVVSSITVALYASCFVLFCSLGWKVDESGCCCCFWLGWLTDRLSGREPFVRFVVGVFRGRLLNFVCVILSLLVLRVGGGM